jgi:Flp pilus assembly protein TadD
MIGRTRRVAGIASLGVLTAAFAGCNPQVLRPKDTAPAAPGAMHAASTADSADPGPLRPSPAQEVLVHIDMARALDKQGQPDKAIAEYQRAVQRYKPAALRGAPVDERAKLHRRLAAALDRLGRFGEAAQHHEEARKLTPEDPRVWNDAGYSAYLQGQWDEAERLLRKAVALDPTDPRAQTNLGLTLAARGDTEAAYAVLARAGSPASARANIAYVLASQGKAEDARAYYARALEGDSKLEVARRALTALDRPATPDASLASHESEVE